MEDEGLSGVELLETFLIKIGTLPMSVNRNLELVALSYGMKKKDK